MAEENPVDPSGIVVAPDTLSIKVGEEAVVQLAVEPAGASQEVVYEFSHDETIQAQLVEGSTNQVTVKGLVAGTTELLIALAGNEGIKAELLIEVTEIDKVADEPSDETPESTQPPAEPGEADESLEKEGGADTAESEVGSESPTAEDEVASPAPVLAKPEQIEVSADAILVLVGDSFEFSVSMLPAEADQRFVVGLDNQHLAKLEDVFLESDSVGRHFKISGAYEGQLNVVINSMADPLLELRIPVTVASETQAAVTEGEPAEDPQVQKERLLSMIIADELSAYAAKMAPNVPHSPEEGASAQVLLYRAIQKVLRLDGNTFTDEMDKLLAFVHEHRKTLFSEYNAFRHMETIALPPKERLSFTRLLNMLIVMADPAARQLSIKQVDITKTMELFNDPQAHQRILGYFGQTE